MRWEGLFEKQKIKRAGWRLVGVGRAGSAGCSRASVETPLPGHPRCCAVRAGVRDGSSPAGLRLSLLCREQDGMASALTRSLWECSRPLCPLWTQRGGKASVGRHEEGRGAQGRASVSLCRYRESNACTTGSPLAQQKSPD